MHARRWWTRTCLSCSLARTRGPWRRRGRSAARRPATWWWPTKSATTATGRSCCAIASSVSHMVGVNHRSRTAPAPVCTWVFFMERGREGQEGGRRRLGRAALAGGVLVRDGHVGAGRCGALSRMPAGSRPQDSGASAMHHMHAACMHHMHSYGSGHLRVPACRQGQAGVCGRRGGIGCVGHAHIPCRGGRRRSAPPARPPPACPSTLIHPSGLGLACLPACLHSHAHARTHASQQQLARAAPS